MQRYYEVTVDYRDDFVFPGRQLVRNGRAKQAREPFLQCSHWNSLPPFLMIIIICLLYLLAYQVPCQK